MEVAFSDNKNCNAFQGLMSNPTDRQAIKGFCKFYNKELLKPSIKVYQRLVSSENGLIYNQTTTGHNRIELVSGRKDKQSLVLKVRIQGDYRKFFNFYQNDTNFCTVEEWEGQFNGIRKIYVLDVNKHDYSGL